MVVHIFINVRDRYITTRRLTEWCLSLPDVQVHLVDNDSTYSPLLEWYKITQARVHYLRDNLGPTGVFKPIGKFVREGNYAISDCDIDSTGVPTDAVEKACRILDANPRIRKVGLALRIDDLPESPHREKALSTEAKYWKRCEFIDGIPCYHSAIDTTFCVMRHGEPHCYEPALRMAGEYTARHMPWYYTEENMPEDEDYYLRHASMHALYYSPGLKRMIADE